MAVSMQWKGIAQTVHAVDADHFWWGEIMVENGKQ
jgi:hypothetical protein